MIITLTYLFFYVRKKQLFDMHRNELNKRVNTLFFIFIGTNDS